MAPPIAPTFVAGGDTQAKAELTHWWRRFGDPVLDRLITRALAQNLDIKTAIAHIDAARAVRGISRAGLFPQIGLGASAERERLSGYQARALDSSTDNQIGAFATASWEPDLFGRIRGGVRAGSAELVATQEDERAVRVALIGEITSLYFQVRGLDARIKIVEESTQAQQKTALLTRRLFDAGAVPIADVDRAQAQAATTGGGKSERELERQIVIHRLAQLLAQPPEMMYATLAPPAVVAMPGTPIGAGVPADLLRQRPDVRAAEARVLAAYARLGVAEADLKPRLTLQGSIGALISGFTGVGLTKAFSWLIGGALDQTLFDGGRKRSTINLRRAEASAAALAYQAAVLQAVTDVENALAATSRDQEREDLLLQASEKARAASDQVFRGWKSGEIAFLDVLEAQRTSLAADDSLAIAQTSIAVDQTRLITAIGG